MISPLKTRQSLNELADKAYRSNKRLVAPLVGFPGCDLLKVSIKVAQQNHGIHYNCIETLVHQLKPDAAFMMMDLSVEANALGIQVRFPTNESSSVEKHPIKTVSDLDRFRCINILHDARIQSYIKTIEMMKLGLSNNVMTGAYIIGPVTLAGLLQSAQQVAMDSVLDTDKLHHICNFTTGIIIEYARALVNAGADIVCILEPTASILGPDQLTEFSGNYVNHIVDSYRYSNVDTVYHVCGNTMHLIEAMSQINVGSLSLDSPETGMDFPLAAQRTGKDTIIIGNVNPTEIMKDGSVEQVTNATNELLDQMRPYPNFILSTGCDLPPGTPLENMKAFMKAGREYE